MPQTEFPVVAGTSYEIYGMSLFNGGLTVLIQHEVGWAMWLPRKVLDIEASALPAGWHFSITGKRYPAGVLEAEWGYEELVGSRETSEALTENRRGALTKFVELVQRQREIQEEPWRKWLYVDRDPSEERFEAVGRFQATDDSGSLDRWVLLHPRETRFPVLEAQRYEIHGMALFAGALYLLIVDEDDKPSWLPHVLFHVTLSRLPEDWYFAVHGSGDEGDELEAMWGYEDIARSSATFYGLLARRHETLALFKTTVGKRPGAS